MKILVTGGCGYIGSHTTVALLERGYDVVIADNLCNSNREVLDRVAAIGRRPVEFHQMDLTDPPSVAGLFTQNTFDAVVHLAGLKSIPDSLSNPAAYYRINLQSLLNLIGPMQAQGCHRLVFSSSAAVYQATDRQPLAENSPRGPAHPYGRTKAMIEDILTDVQTALPDTWRIACLRYFNPVGAHPSGMLGENPSQPPGNLFPALVRVALGEEAKLAIFGHDYPTADGTCVRDFIHVCDLAAGHVLALEQLDALTRATTLNLGTGRGASVLEVLHAFEQASGRPIPHHFVDRRPGDMPVCIADPSRARSLLGWQAQRSLADMCEDEWRWRSGRYGTP